MQLAGKRQEKRAHGIKCCFGAALRQLRRCTRGPQQRASLTLLLRHFFAADQVPVGGSEDQELPSALGALEFLQRAGRIHQPSRGHLNLVGIFCMRGRASLQNIPACRCSPIHSLFCTQACNQNCISELNVKGTREIFCNLTLKPLLHPQKGTEAKRSPFLAPPPCPLANGSETRGFALCRKEQGPAQRPALVN